jgi:hypothetical protein
VVFDGEGRFPYEVFGEAFDGRCGGFNMPPYSIQESGFRELPDLILTDSFAVELSCQPHA